MSTPNIATSAGFANEALSASTNVGVIPYKDYPDVKDTALQSQPPSWQWAISHAMKAVVDVHFAFVERFDGEGPLSSRASGFVVDKKHGYILTNRHVTGSGPGYGYCVFGNRELHDVTVAYVDPIHDFAFLQYNPSALEANKDIEELHLRPDLAQVGMDVKCIGHDFAQGISVGTGIISRLDAESPFDPNTNYIQASVSMVGGSSGSPVIDSHGNVLGLMCAGFNTTSIAQFLPLHRIVRALQLLKSGESIARGTIHANWTSLSYSSCRERGMSSEHIKVLRHTKPASSTVLVNNFVLTNGLAANKLQVGDILMGIGDKCNPDFNELEEMLDCNVGKAIEIQVWRTGRVLQLELEVASLYECVASRYLKIGTCILQDVSLHIAARCFLPQAGVLCTVAGFAPELKDMVIITAVNKRPISNLESMMSVLRNDGPADLIRISYFELAQRDTIHEAFIPVLPHLYRAHELWYRNDRGEWICMEIPLITPQIRSAIAPVRSDRKSKRSWLQRLKIEPCVVQVTCTMPIPVDGFSHNTRVKQGLGIVVDVAARFVLVSRATSPHAMIDTKVTIDHHERSAEIAFLHPLHGYALVRYSDGAGHDSLNAIKLAHSYAKAGDIVLQVSVNEDRSVSSTPGLITQIAIPRLPRDRQVQLNKPCNFNSMQIASHLPLSDSTVLFNARRQAIGICVSFGDDDMKQLLKNLQRNPTREDINEIIEEFQFAPQLAAIHAADIASTISMVKQDITMRFLPFEHKQISLETAIKHGLSAHWTSRFTSQEQTQVIYTVSDPVKNVLESGDMLLELDHELVTNATQMGRTYTSMSVAATIFRNSQQIQLEIPTVSSVEIETSCAINFCGMVLQRPHLTIRRMMLDLPSEVYISAVLPGSPADLYEVTANSFITHVNDVQAPDLEVLSKMIETIPDHTPFSLRLTSVSREERVVILKGYERFFPFKRYESVNGRLKFCE